MFESTFTKIALGCYITFIIMILITLGLHSEMYASLLIFLGVSIPVMFIAIYDVECNIYAAANVANEANGGCETWGIIKGIGLICILVTLVILMIMVLADYSKSTPSPAPIPETNNSAKTKNAVSSITGGGSPPSVTTPASSLANKAFPQVGTLIYNGDSGEPIVLPLYGLAESNGDFWQYYVIYKDAQLPVLFADQYNNGSKGTVRDCTLPRGCDKIQNDDSVKVPDYNKKITFTAKLSLPNLESNT